MYHTNLYEYKSNRVGLDHKHNTHVKPYYVYGLDIIYPYKYGSGQFAFSLTEENYANILEQLPGHMEYISTHPQLKFMVTEIFNPQRYGPYANEALLVAINSPEEQQDNELEVDMGVCLILMTGKT